MPSYWGVGAVVAGGFAVCPWQGQKRLPATKWTCQRDTVGCLNFLLRRIQWYARPNTNFSPVAP